MEFEMDCIANMLRDKFSNPVKEWESVWKKVFPKENFHTVNDEVVKWID